MLHDDDVLRNVFEFLGKGHYRSVAGTCRRFRRMYRRIDTHTSAKEFVKTIAGAKLFYKEEKKKTQRGRSLLFIRRTVDRRKEKLHFIYYSALENGSLEVVKWAASSAIAEEVELNDRWTCAMAARSGDVRLLKWARANGYPWGEDVCSFAASSGHVEVLQWARANGCPWDERTCQSAAHNGRLEALQWARANGCPWNTAVCVVAAKRGHLDVIQWARANGCPSDTTVCMVAAWYGYLDLARWAWVNGCRAYVRVCCEKWPLGFCQMGLGEWLSY